MPDPIIVSVLTVYTWSDGTIDANLSGPSTTVLLTAGTPEQALDAVRAVLQIDGTDAPT